MMSRTRRNDEFPNDDGLRACFEKEGKTSKFAILSLTYKFEFQSER